MLLRLIVVRSALWSLPTNDAMISDGRLALRVFKMFNEDFFGSAYVDTQGRRIYYEGVGAMPEGITAEIIFNNIMETVSDSASKQKHVSFFEEEKSSSVASQFNRLFGRQKPVHHLLGGGKSADVLLWRNKKMSASVLTGATAVWVLFEWLNYHFLTLLCLVLVVGMLAQFVWSNASGIINSDNRSPSKVPRLVLPDELFVNTAISIGSEVNRALGFLQDVACGGNIKQLLVVVLSLWGAAIIGSWCNFLTVLYIGFLAAHTLPAFYERYEDQVDSFADSVLGQLQHRYRKLDAGVLSKIPRGRFMAKKYQ
ncbi:hypothetical protein RJ639_013719 [Escallonia herrerae]|uniref:Reticulon-like protein n=1 Tax=Escallonia herrerae TaxID=1293975 RepID=A0AA89ANY5_9ASTE|nr:hypothetical protein RJ639_013719 [Escallonia herrerae]